MKQGQPWVVLSLIVDLIFLLSLDTFADDNEQDEADEQVEHGEVVGVDDEHDVVEIDLFLSFSVDF